MKYEHFTHKFVSIINILHNMCPWIQKEVQCKPFYQWYFHHVQHYM